MYVYCLHLVVITSVPLSTPALSAPTVTVLPLVLLLAIKSTIKHERTLCSDFPALEQQHHWHHAQGKPHKAQQAACPAEAQCREQLTGCERQKGAEAVAAK